MARTDIKPEEYRGIDSTCLGRILSGVTKARIALVGDLCIDMYWRADMTRSEISRETPHYPLPVVEEWASPGAGGNAAVNIAALNPEKLYLIGVIGKDWRGDILGRELSRYGNIDTGRVITSGSWVTNAYCKPLRRGISELEYEDPRIDFSNYTPLPPEDENSVIAALEETADRVDVICVSDQFRYGCITPGVRNKIIELGRKGHTVVVDSRYEIGLFTDVILKPNEIEGWRAVYREDDERGGTLGEYAAAACTLAVKNNARVCMTLGKNGCVYTDGKNTIHIPSHNVEPPIDICGAGDTFLSAFSCALAAGAKAHEAASFANIAAEVTIKKIGTTGTATAAEIEKRHREIFSG
jgi:rfaE bifunctional protein kinase chain/domain